MPTKFIPVKGQLGLHSDDDDAGVSADYRYYLNGYFEAQEGLDESRKLAFVKRPGLHTVWAGSGGAGDAFDAGYKIQGMVSSAERTRLVVFANNGVTNKTYHVTLGSVTDKGAAPAAAGAWTATSAVAFTQLDNISYGANVQYAATDFTKGAVIDSNGNWTEITDTDFTGLSKCSNFCGLDGYLFIATTNNRIYNSGQNAATTWSALDFLTAHDAPGRIMWLSKIRHYLIAFKDKSIEFFEDLGNPAPGSPLEPRKSLNRKIGLLHRNTIQEVSDGIIFAGVSESGVSKIYKINSASLEITPISNRYLEQQLVMLKVVTTITDYSVDATATGSFLGQSQTFSFGNKEFYTINLNDLDSNKQKFTQVYDNTLGTWTSWASCCTVSGTLDSMGFRGSQARSAASGTVMHPVFVVNNGILTTTPCIMAMDTSTSVAFYDRDDNGGAQNLYPFSWTTDQLDFGSRKRKFCDEVEVHYSGDSSETPSRTASTSLTVQYRDWDYNTTAAYTVTRSLYYDLGGGVRCRASRWGNFRKRSFSVTQSAASPFRIWGLEIRYNEGEQDQDS